MQAVRILVALIVGLFVGGFVNSMIITVGPMIIPPPAGVDVTSPETLAASSHLFGPQHFIFPFLAHAVGTFVACVLVCLISPQYKILLAYLVAALFLVGGITVGFLIPAPAWFVFVDLAFAYIPMAYLALKVLKINPLPTDLTTL